MSQSKKVVLIVDDEPDTCTYFSTILQDNGYETVIAYDGADGRAKLEEAVPDLVTLDITMPEKSGVRLYREMKESDQWKNVPVIIVTGVSGDFEKFISTRSQVPPPEGYMAKPIDPDEFLKIAKELTS
ncbi:response regulator [candidate division LCP-89 bacterium B3_LCP]|uniref:Response regulator n=1 Tax=candidate division LCP-89 bacterium B3_LCP TaxID=2012998 RepID=A0A532UQU0_UNCL8|nr:MAG: response regulator [candidate division LCP-89 bacterium B3_LCP]